jgi:hypothetical protein
MTAAAIATTATVEAATITRPLYHRYLRAKRWAAAAEFFESAGFHRRRTARSAGRERPNAGEVR